jgi:hypothetical protein
MSSSPRKLLNKTLFQINSLSILRLAEDLEPHAEWTLLKHHSIPINFTILFLENNQFSLEFSDIVNNSNPIPVAKYGRLIFKNVESPDFLNLLEILDRADKSCDLRKINKEVFQIKIFNDIGKFDEDDLDIALAVRAIHHKPDPDQILFAIANSLVLENKIIKELEFITYV